MGASDLEPKFGCSRRGLSGRVLAVGLSLPCLVHGGVVGSAIAWSVSRLPGMSFEFLGAASALGRASEVVRMLGRARCPACLPVFGCFWFVPVCSWFFLAFYP
jgi:hypothetical protein